MYALLKLSTRNIALIAIFAALYYVLSLVSPKIPSIGLPDLKIQLEALMASVFGFVLGPYLGALTAFLGAFVTWVLPPASMTPTGAPFLLSPPLNALIVGFVFYRKWKWAFASLSVLIAAFLFLPPSQPITNYYYVPAAVLWDKVIALLLIIPTVILSRKLSNPKESGVLFFFISFIGNQTDNMWGADIFAVPLVYGVVFGMPLDSVRVAFIVSPFIYPLIRFIQAIFATIITVPLMRALKDTAWIIREKSIFEQQV
jgi:ECF transporter S component (folate family)